MDNWSRLEAVPRGCGHPARNGSSARSSRRSSGRATAGTRSSWNTTPCDLRLCAATRASPPNRRRRPKTPTSPASGRCTRRSRAPRRSRRSGSGQGRSAAGYSPDDHDASPAIPRLRCKSRGPRRRVARQPTPSVARVHTLSLRSLRMTSDGSLLVSQAAWAGNQKQAHGGTLRRPRASMARAPSGSWQCAQARYGSGGAPSSNRRSAPLGYVGGAAREVLGKHAGEFGDRHLEPRPGAWL
jgi:hypothetical protein